jgi:hypothetical protein
VRRLINFIDYKELKAVRRMKKLTVLLVCVSIISSMTAACFARSDACFKGQKDAEAMESGYKFLFFGAGCILGPIGMLLGYEVIPPAPESRIMGKTSSYTADYLSCYEDAVRNTQVGASTIGCAGLAVAAAVTGFIMFLKSMPVY